MSVTTIDLNFIRKISLRPMWSQSYDFGTYNYNASVLCSRLERFFMVEENISVLKTDCSTRGFVNFYTACVVIPDCRIGSRSPKHS
jgi:hypothetical protein